METIREGKAPKQNPNPYNEDYSGTYECEKCHAVVKLEKKDWCRVIPGFSFRKGFYYWVSCPTEHCGDSQILWRKSRIIVQRRYD